MKYLLTVPLFLLYYSTNAQPVYGPAITFGYSTMGTRVWRAYEPITVLNKYGDTLTPQSYADTLTKKEDNDIFVIKAYPNPVHNLLTIHNFTWKETDQVFVKVFDIAGRFISSQSFTKGKDNINFSEFIPGVYQVHYYLNGSLLTMWKIVKQ